MVFLDETPEEYPVGRKGRHVLKWVARHVRSSFLFKIDDDLYVRTAPLFARLASLQRTALYWGFFDYSGQVAASRQ